MCSSKKMSRHVWFGEASLLLRSSKPSIKYHIHYTHTRHKTRPRLRSLTAAGGFASFYMLGLGEVSVAAVGWVVGSAVTQAQSRSYFPGEIQLFSRRRRPQNTGTSVFLSRVHSAAELHRPAGEVNGRP